MPETQKYTETDLILLLRQREQSAFSYLYDNYSGALYGIILSIVPDKELANDVLQEENFLTSRDLHGMKFPKH